MLANTHFCKGCLQVLQDVYTEIYWGSFCSGCNKLLFRYSWHIRCREMNQLWCSKCVLLKKCYLGLHILFPSLEPILRCGIHNFPQIGTCLLCVWVGSKNLIWEKWVHVAYMSTILTFVKEQISVCVTHAALHTSWTDAWFCRCYRFQSLEIFHIAFMILRSGFNFCPF